MSARGNTALDFLQVSELPTPNELDVDAMQKVLKSRIDQYYGRKAKHPSKKTAKNKGSSRRPVSAKLKRGLYCPTPSDPSTQRNRDLTSHEALYEQVVKMKEQIRDLEKQNLKLSSQNQRYEKLLTNQNVCSKPPAVPVRRRPSSAKPAASRKQPARARPPDSKHTPVLLKTRYTELLQLREQVKQLSSMGEQQLKVIQRRDLKISVLEARIGAYEHLDEFAKATENGAGCTGPSTHQQNKVLAAQFAALRRQTRYISFMEQQVADSDKTFTQANMGSRTSKHWQAQRPFSAKERTSRSSKTKSKIVYESRNAISRNRTGDGDEEEMRFRKPRLSDVNVKVYGDRQHAKVTSNNTPPAPWSGMEIGKPGDIYQASNQDDEDSESETFTDSSQESETSYED